MACIGTGKISEQAGLREALELVRARPVSEGVLRILSKEASGRIGVRGGRFIIGTHITSSGLSGYPALKAFLALKRGMFYYLEGAEAGGLTDLEQSLGVDIEGLLWHCQTANDLLRRFSEISQEYGWDCVTEVVVNPHPPQAGPVPFGDSFLDRIAWTATNTMQRLQSLGARQKSHQPVGEGLTSQAPSPLVGALPEEASSQLSAGPAQVPGPLAPFAQQGDGGTAPPQPNFVIPGLSNALSVCAQQVRSTFSRLHKVSAPPEAQANWAAQPGGDQGAIPQNTPPPVAGQFAGRANVADLPQINPASFAPPLKGQPLATEAVASAESAPAFAFSSKAANDQQPFAVSPAAPQPQQAQVSTAEKRSSAETPAWLPPIPPPAETLRQEQAQELAEGETAAVWYKQSGETNAAAPSRQAPPVVSPRQSGTPDADASAGQQPHNFMDRIAQTARSTMQGLKTLRVAPTKQDSVLNKISATARSTMQGLKALGNIGAPEDVWNVANQKQRALSRHTRDEKERLRAFAERTADSQKLRVMDIEEAMAEYEQRQPPVKKLLKRFDLASAGGLFLIGGAIALFALSFLTLTALNSDDESVKLAKAYTEQGKIDQAVEQLTLALQHKPGDTKLLMWRADLYDKLNDYEHESQDYDAVSAAHPENKNAGLKNAMLSNRLSNYSRALEISKKLLERFPGDQDVIACHAIALSGAGDYQQALDAIAKIKDEDKLDKGLVAPLNRARGYAYFNLKDPDKAMRSYVVAINLEPRNAALHHEIAEVFEQLKKYDQAIDHLKQAIDLLPTDGWNYEELGKAYDLKHDFDNALKAYNDAVKMIPRPADDYARMAQDEMTLQHYAQALTDCDLAERLVPRHPQAEKIKEMTLAKQKAEKPIQTASASDEPKPPLSDPNSSLSKGYKALKQGHYPQALQYLTAAVKNDSEDPDARLLLALAYSRTGHKAEAYEQFSWLDSNQRLPVQDKFVFADCAMATGHPERALTIYADCLEQQPTWVDARCRMIKACLTAGLTERANAVAQEGIMRAKDDAEKQMYEAALKSASSGK